MSRTGKEQPIEDSHSLSESGAAAVGDTAALEAQRKKLASKIVRAHAGYSAVGGLIPLPAIDVATSATVQVRMAAKLCTLYDLSFDKQAVKSTVSAFIASALPKVGIGYSIFSLVKGVPLVGPLLGVATMPALNAALTWALGRVLIWHFGSGGTLESLHSDEAISRFKREFQDAKARFGADKDGNPASTSNPDPAEIA